MPLYILRYYDDEQELLLVRTVTCDTTEAALEWSHRHTTENFASLEVTEVDKVMWRGAREAALNAGVKGKK